MIQKYTVTAEGEGRVDILSRISMLFMQRHIDVESLTYKPQGSAISKYEVCALATEETVSKVVSQMKHIEGLNNINYK